MPFVQLTFACLAVGAFAGDRFNNPGFRGFGSGLGFGGARLLGSAASIDPVYPPQPYNFGYDTADEYGTKQFHKEQGDASNTKTGTYGYSDANGLFRRVNYVADAGGFRATVETNEPGTEAGQSADAVFNANPVVTGPTAAAAYAVPAYARYGGFGGHH
ncbi:cuticle protein, putative [Ixodes scapularis]|uniref:Cuticle protein, putative n=1 Tax=Ixodes scapularis TaxID=6945 RepID=B7PEU3_IXOSC|nr:cuticle protein, putative [Ixodes scapularis]|eukprot:XP_002433715.1 cuticle protein, putative [Ixodes scapularis]